MDIIDFQERSSKDILGIVFYSGENIVGFGEKLFAVPLGFLLQGYGSVESGDLIIGV